MTATPEPAPVADPADVDRRRLPVLASPQPMRENLVVRVFVAVPMLALLVAVPFGWPTPRRLVRLAARR